MKGNPAEGRQEVLKQRVISRYLEGEADLAGHQLLHGGQHDGVTDLLPLAVSLHLTIQSWRLPGLGVGVVWAHCVNLRSTGKPCR